MIKQRKNKVDIKDKSIILNYDNTIYTNSLNIIKLSVERDKILELDRHNNLNVGAFNIPIKDLVHYYNVLKHELDDFLVNDKTVLYIDITGDKISKIQHK